MTKQTKETPRKSDLAQIAVSGITRRDFLRTTALATAAASMTGPSIVRAQASQKLNIGIIGCGGKGLSDMHSVSSENIIALCDVDENAAGQARKDQPKANFYHDFRLMLEKEKTLDAVIVATPDHLHAPASVMAMRLGKHVYCQKPLTQSVYEARLMREVAAEKKVASQMGNQGSAEDGLRRAVEVIQAGTIGAVREVHVWSNRPIWPQGIDRPNEYQPVPNHIDWYLWLGPAPDRPYHSAYMPFRWRGWQDFGTGALGDMACHTANMPFRALKLGYPTEIEAESTGMNKETYPNSSKIRFEFPAREGMPALTFRWYDGGWKPNPDATKEVNDLLGNIPGSGCLLVGDKGKLFSPDDYGSQFYIMLGDEKELMSGRDHAAIKDIPVTIPRSPGHYKEWLNACKGGVPAYSDFAIAGYLTEIILLGCVALRVGKKIQWDGPNMKAVNCPEAAQYVRRENREGWKL